MNDDVLTVEKADLRSLFGLPSLDEGTTLAKRDLQAPVRTLRRRRMRTDWTLQQRQFFQNHLP